MKGASLRSALRASLFPLAAARGFVLDRSAQPQFMTFRRQSGGEVHVFDVQWDKSGQPRFIINFGKAPARGVMRQGTPVPADQVEVYDCHPMLRLQRRRGGSMGCWFQLRRPLLPQLTRWSRDYSPDEVAQSVVARFEEVESWFRSGERGPHVHGIDRAT